MPIASTTELAPETAAASSLLSGNGYVDTPWSDRFAMRVDVRDHIFSYDLLNVRQNTQNLELTTGIAYYF